MFIKNKMFRQLPNFVETYNNSRILKFLKYMQ